MSDDDSEDLSRTQMKELEREEQAQLEEFGKLLATLPEKTLTTLDLDPTLHEAIRTFATMPKGPGMARQRRFVARLLRSYELDALRERVQIARGVSSDPSKIYRLEKWRTRLVEEGDAALNELMLEHPQADRQRLRQAIRSAKTEKEAGQTNKQWKALFQLIKELGEPTPPESGTDSIP